MLRFVVTGLLVLVLLPGCAMFRGKPASPPDLSTIAISTTGEPDLDLHAKTTLRRILIGTGSGAVTGGVAAGAGTIATGVIIGAATGPFMVIPVGIAFGVAPFVAAAGAVVGGVVGGTSGAIVGGLSWKSAGEMNALLKDPNNMMSFTQDLGTAVRAGVPGERQVERADALTLVALELTDVELTQYRSDNMAIKMSASARYSWGHKAHAGHRRSQSKPTTATCTYNFETEKVHVSKWLEGGPEFLSSIYTEAINGTAAVITRDLNAQVPTAQETVSGPLGTRMKKLPSGDYDLILDDKEKQKSACMEALRNAR